MRNGLSEGSVPRKVGSTMAHSGGSRAFVSRMRVRVPRVPVQSVHRARLVEKAIGRDPVTLVCAPAGSGKTMAVADWATKEPVAGTRVAWLTLEERDDRPYEFWSAVIEAFIAAAPQAAAGRLDALSPPRRGSEPAFVTALADIVASEPSLGWLVLDDVHHLTEPDVLAGLEQLVSPGRAEIGTVLLCRSEPALPLHRWRLDGVLGEVRGPDLAFTETEAAELLGGLETPLDRGHVARLVARTEGWAAGLRLAAVSLAATADPVQFLSGFEGDQREVADYLFAEIVQHLPTELADFLVQTCTPEQISVDLAAHLSGRADAGEVLDQLCRANALVVQAGDSSWYRYHSLLRGYLLATLARRDVTGPRRQHSRTARWFDEHEEPAIALEQAVLAHEHDLLRELTERNGLRLVLSGHAAAVSDAIGAPSRDFADDPRVAVVAALAALDLMDLELADEWVSVLQKQSPHTDSRFAALRASALVQRVLLGGDVPAVLTTSGILDLESTGDPDVDLMVLTYRAPGRLRIGDYHGAISDLRRALRVATARRYDQFVLWILSQLSATSGTLCDFRASLDWAQQAIAFAVPRGWGGSPRLAYAYLLAAWTAFQTGDVPAQTDYAQRGLAALHGVNNVEVEMGVRSMHALAVFEVSEGADRRDAAQRFHELWQADAADEVSPALNSLATPQEVRLALALGRTDWAREAVARLQRQLPGSAESAAIGAQLLAARGRVRGALDVLAPVLDEQVPAHVVTTRVSAQVLAACLESSLGNEHRAFLALQRALEWAAPNGYRRPFVDAWADLEGLLSTHRGRFGAAEAFVDQLLTRHRQPASAAGSVLDPTLTEREFEVLRDLPSMLTIREIAGAQKVSENTVKTHLRSIYHKLGVSSRQSAVREARSRGLL